MNLCGRIPASPSQSPAGGGVKALVFKKFLRKGDGDRREKGEQRWMEKLEGMVNKGEGIW